MGFRDTSGGALRRRGGGVEAIRRDISVGGPLSRVVEIDDDLEVVIFEVPEHVSLAIMSEMGRIQEAVLPLLGHVMKLAKAIRPHKKAIGGLVEAAVSGVWAVVRPWLKEGHVDLVAMKGDFFEAKGVEKSSARRIKEILNAWIGSEG